MVFGQVAERGSFSAAGRQMGLSRAVVSYHIKKLEEYYGLRLFNRSTRSLNLTEAGGKLYKHCRVIMDEAQSARRAVERFKQEPEGTLRISCPVNFGLERMVPILSRFKDLYPKIDLDIQFTDAVANLLRDSIDLAIRGAPLPDSDLQAVRLATIRHCLCAAPDYLQRHGHPTTFADLDKHIWVVYDRTGAIELTAKDGKRASMHPAGGIRTDNAAARTAFVEAGHGIGRIPRYDADPKIRKGLLEEIMPEVALPATDLFAVFLPGTSTSRNLRLLIDYSKQALGGNPVN
nr:LysR family transcriptional regulator [Roseibium sp. RKSG952]